MANGARYTTRISGRGILREIRQFTPAKAGLDKKLGRMRPFGARWLCQEYEAETGDGILCLSCAMCARPHCRKCAVKIMDKQFSKAGALCLSCERKEQR